MLTWIPANTPPPPAAEGGVPRPVWLRPELVSSWAEFILVTTLLLVLPIRSATLSALRGSGIGTHYVQIVARNEQLGWTAVYEAIALVLFLAYLRWRGWRWADLRIGIGWLSSLEGLALWLVGEAAVIATMAVIMGTIFLLVPHTSFLALLAGISPHIAPHSIHLDWSVIIIAMVVNAVIEEVACMGYVFNQVAARWGPVAAIVFTIFLRAACHTYQDPIHVTAIAVLFTVYAVCYWMVRKLWPLILAHILLDVCALSFLKVMFS